jgi:hypothetical protein
MKGEYQLSGVGNKSAVTVPYCELRRIIESSVVKAQELLVASAEIYVLRESKSGC